MATKRKRGKRSRRVRDELPGELRGALPTRLPRTSVRPPIDLDDQEAAQLLLAVTCAWDTVQRWAAGLPVYRTTGLRLERALVTLQIVKRPKAPKVTRRRVAIGAAAA